MDEKVLEARNWYDSAIKAANERAKYVVSGAGQQTLHMNSFMEGVRWVITHQPIPDLYKQ